LWKNLNPVFSRVIEYLPGATPVIETGVEPFRSGIPEPPSSTRTRMTAAPGGVDATSMTPPPTEAVGDGEALALLTFDAAAGDVLRAALFELLLALFTGLPQLTKRAAAREARTALNNGLTRCISDAPSSRNCCRRRRDFIESR